MWAPVTIPNKVGTPAARGAGTSSVGASSINMSKQYAWGTFLSFLIASDSDTE